MGLSFLPVPGLDTIVDKVSEYIPGGEMLQQAMDPVGTVMGAIGLGNGQAAFDHTGDVIMDGAAHSLVSVVGGAGAALIAAPKQFMDVGMDLTGMGDGQAGIQDWNNISPLHSLQTMAEGAHVAEGAFNWVQDKSGMTVERNGEGDEYAYMAGEFLSMIGPQALARGAVEVGVLVGDETMPEEEAPTQEQPVETGPEQQEGTTMPTVENEENYVLTTRAEKSTVEVQEQEVSTNSVSGTGWFSDDFETATTAPKGQDPAMTGIVPDNSPVWSPQQGGSSKGMGNATTSHADSATSVAASMDGESNGGPLSFLTGIFGDSASGGGLDLGSLDFGGIIQSLLSSLGLNFGGAESADVPQNAAEELTTGTSEAVAQSQQPTAPEIPDRSTMPPAISMPSSAPGM